MPKILKIWLKIDFSHRIPILFLVLSSMYNAGTAWPVRVSANESCITPLHLLRVINDTRKPALWIFLAPLEGLMQFLPSFSE